MRAEFLSGLWLLVLLSSAPMLAASPNPPEITASSALDTPAKLTSPDAVPDVPLADRRTSSTSAGDQVTTLDRMASPATDAGAILGRERAAESATDAGKHRQLSLHETSLPPPSV